jgi:hypothetical protein
MKDKKPNSSGINLLSAALSRAQGEMKAATQSSTNTFFKSRYSTLSDVFDAIREPLSKNELCVMQKTKFRPGQGNERGYHYIETILSHSSGQYVTCETFVFCEKPDAQSYGKAITYAKRYGLMALVGVASAEDDDDGETAMGRDPVLDLEQQNYLRTLFKEDKVFEKQVLTLCKVDSVEKIQVKHAKAIHNLIERRKKNADS